MLHHIRRFSLEIVVLGKLLTAGTNWHGFPASCAEQHCTATVSSGKGIPCRVENRYGSWLDMAKIELSVLSSYVLVEESEAPASERRQLMRG